MSNEELYSELAKNFSNEQLRIYCIVSAMKYDVLMRDFKKHNPNIPTEYEYDMEWHLLKYQELSKNMRNYAED